MHDTRTPAEIAYDATRLSPLALDSLTPEAIAEAEAIEHAEQQRLARLGLAEQALQFTFTSDHTLWLCGEGTMTICGDDGIPALLLDLQQTARLIVFLQSPRAQKLIPAILLASLREQGGPGAQAAELVLQEIAAGRGNEVCRMLKQVHDLRWPSA